VTASSDRSIKVERVFALVELQDRVVKETREREAAAGAGTPRALMLINDPSGDGLNVYVRLSAQTSDGQRIPSGRIDFGMGGGRHGISGVWHRYHGPRPDNDQNLDEYIQRHHHVGPADLEDGINQMLGRDPNLHRPPRLAWIRLIEALAEHDIQATEEDLIAVPLTVELHPEVQTDLEKRP
jgi:hypothetical protein